MRSTTSRYSSTAAPETRRAAAPVVRAVTASLDGAEDIAVRGLFEGLRAELDDRGMPVQTCRVVAPVVASHELVDEAFVLASIEAAAARATDLGARWFLVPFDMVALGSKDCRRVGSIAFETLRRFPNAFVNLIVADGQHVNPAAATAASRTIAEAAQLSANGFDNFRLGVSLNPRADGAFFPFSRLERPRSFALAVEVTRLLTEVAESAADVAEFQQKGLDALAERACELSEVAGDAARRHGLLFAGLDLSVAPYPDADVSVLPLLRHLGLEQFGGQGTFFLTGIISRLLKSAARRAAVPTVGFNGLMYSVLEDPQLAGAVRRRTFGLDSLLGYSTMCGCGIDMVPVPGDVAVEEMASMILDVAAVAIGLDKPLGVRLLPIPGRAANEETAFDLDFLINTKILPVRNLSLDDGVLSAGPTGLWP